MKKVKHGLTHHRLYPTWVDMMARCYNPNNKRYSSYGERGIKVCDEWHNVENFINDMYPSFEEGLSIDRINNDGNYEKSNCRWANVNIQARNKRKLRKTNTSGYRGVTWHKRDKIWVSYICVNKKIIYICSSKDKIEAAKAYDQYIMNNNLEHTKNF